MDDSITAVLSKVQKLRRLAGSPNPHEAALAKAKAQEVLERAGLDESWMRAYARCAHFPNPAEVLDTIHKMQTLVENYQAASDRSVAEILARHGAKLVTTVKRKERKGVKR